MARASSVSMPKGHYERKVTSLPNALDDRLTTLELTRGKDEERIAALEKRVREMNEAFERGYLPANVQAHS